jgi:uncharacterized Zn finger protein
MESIARTSGDLDTLIAIKSRNLAYPYNFLEVAELHREAGRPDEALEWAERGLNSFSDRPDPRLVEFVSNTYHERGRHDKAMALIWPRFTDHPNLETYRNLKRHANTAGSWATRRDRTLTHLRKIRDMPNPTASQIWQAQSAQETLIQILLAEQKHAVAWQEYLQRPFSGSVELALAASREVDHPADVLAIYERAAEAAIAQTDGRGYDKAVVHLTKLKRLHHKLEWVEAWTALINRIRTTHRRKRSFIARTINL